MIKNKKKLVRDLVKAFDDRDHLHQAYKEKIKQMLMEYTESLAYLPSDCTGEMIEEFIDIYVETRFKPEL